MKNQAAKLFLFTVIAIFCFVNTGHAVGDTDPVFLQIWPDARGNALGGSLVAVADPAATYYNPAAIGMFSLNNLGAIGYAETDYFSSSSIDIEHTYFYANFGINNSVWKTSSPHNFSIGLQYKKQFLGYTQTYGVPVTTSDESYEKNKSITLGLAAERTVAIAVGATINNIKKRGGPWTDKGRAYDFGFQVSAPVFRSLVALGMRAENRSESPNLYEFLLSFGWSRLNEGSGMEDGIQPFPRMSRYGFALDFNWNYKSIRALRLLFLKSWTKHLEEKDYDGDPQTEEGWGLELTFADVFIYRTGEASFATSDLNKDTWGVSFQTRGFTYSFYNLYLRNQYPEGSFLHFLLTHVNIAYHHAIEDSENSYINGRNWFEFSLSF